MGVYYKCHQKKLLDNNNFDTSRQGEDGTYQKIAMVNSATKLAMFLEKLA